MRKQTITFKGLSATLEASPNVSSYLKTHTGLSQTFATDIHLLVIIHTCIPN